MNAALFTGEQRAGAAKAHRDFVGNQKNTVRVAQLTHAAQVVRVVHAHAAGALHQGLQDKGTDFAGMGREQRCQGIGSGLGTGARAGVILRAKCIRRWRKQHVQQQRCVHPPIQRQIAHRQRTQGFTMVAASQGYEAGAASDALVMKPVVGHFQRDFDPGRPIVGIEHLGQGCPPGLLRGTRKQAFGQLHRWRV